MTLNSLLTPLTTLQATPLWIALTTPPLCLVLGAIYHYMINGIKSTLAGKWSGSCRLSKSQTLDVALSIVPLGKKLYGTAKVTTDSDVRYTFIIREKLAANDWISISLKSKRSFFSSSMMIKLQGSKLTGKMTVTMSSDTEPTHGKISLDKIYNLI